MASLIGQQLSQARQEKGVTLDQVAQATHIRVHYLRALEMDDASALPSPVQMRGFLRLYAGYLGLDPKSLLDALDGKPTAAEAPATPDQAQTIPSEPASDVAPSGVNVSPQEIVPPPSPPAPEESQAEEEFAEPAQQELPGPADSSSVAPSPPQPVPASQHIFEEIGQQLRQQRELLSLSMTDVERYTRLRIHYLKAMEDGNMEALPSMVQGRGMLNNYAHFLNLDADKILSRYADGLRARREEKMAAEAPVKKNPKPATRPTLGRMVTMDMLVGGGFIVLLFVFGLWGASRVMALRSSQAVSPTAPSIADMLLASPSEAATLTTLTPEATLAATSDLGVAPLPSAQSTLAATSGLGVAPLPAAQDTLVITALPTSDAAIQIYVAARQSAWIRVTVDNVVKFTGRVLAGSAYPFSGTRQIELLTGNAAALEVIYNQTDLGTLGTEGQVLDLIFTASGMITPTATTTPTVTRTPLVTQTPQPTRTSTPSPTAQQPTSTATPSPKP